jgi:undecaprenyl-diphosphatase
MFGRRMEIWQALILGIVEGITEYLPVSSTGHLLVAQRLLGIEASAAANAYAIAIQAGAIVAVIGLYWSRCLQMLQGVLGRHPEGLGLLARLVVAFVPAAVLGLLFDEAIEARLFGPWPIVAAWSLGGVLILALPRRFLSGGDGEMTTMAWSAAVLIGFAQCAALWPGTSRSLATILGGLLAGLSLASAVEFSFLLGLLTLGAATSYKALDEGPAMLNEYGVGAIAAGFAAAWISAVLAVRWMVSWLQRRGLRLFGWWRLGAALAVSLLILTGTL